MLGKQLQSAWKTNAMLAVLALSLLTPLTAALGEESGATTTSNATLSAFADGTVSKTLTFAAGADAASSVLIHLPQGSVVADAALTARATADSAVSSGALVFDVGADGTADATASVNVLADTRVEIPANAVNAYLETHGFANAAVDVVVKITGAAASGWSVVVDDLKVDYALRGTVAARPTFTGEVGAVAVVAGETNFSAVDLGAHFASGGNLTFSGALAADADASASGLAVVVNGTHADIRASNPDFWGEVLVHFAAVDASGQVALSNDVAVHIEPRPVSQPTVRTEARTGAEAVLVLGCGSPGLVERFEIPSDAIVTDARMTVEGAVSASLLGTTVEILAGAEAAAGLNGSELPRAVELNTSVLNAGLSGQASAFGLVNLDFGADVCPSGALDGLTVSNISVTYVRGALNGTAAPEPVIADIAVEGEAGAQVAADEDLTVQLLTNKTLGASSQVQWYVDGKLSGSGETLTSVELSQGEHTIEARTTADAAVHIYRTTVNASARAGAEAQIAINGAVTAAVKSGESLILELRTPQPMAAGANITWYVDGKLAGRGQVLADVRLAAGVHTVEARSNSSGTIHSYAAQVTANPVPPSANIVAALAVSGLLAAAAVGIVVARRRSR